LVPAINIIIALPFLYRYPITRRSHAEVRAKLESMEKTAGDGEPVRTV